MASLDHSPEAAHGVLHGLYWWARGAGELVEVSIKSPRGKWHAQHWDVDTLLSAETIKQLGWWSSQGREIYMGCVGLTSKPTSTPRNPYPRGGAALRGHAGALWLDVDCQAPGREGDDYFGRVEDAIEMVDAALGPVLADASVVVGSGWGVQYWVPLAEPVPGSDASRMVRVLVGYLTEVTVKKIDRVWDVTRVMRMPGTLNWRAGPDEDEARPTGVLRWPGADRRAAARLDLENVIEVLARQVSDVLDDHELAKLELGEFVDRMLERYAPGSADGGGGGGGGAAWDGREIYGDLNRMAEQTWIRWEDVLIPYGWRATTRLDEDGRGGREQIWERPGKGGLGGYVGERSAVVYADKPELLVVYSDSPLTGFSAGLMGSGRRGTAAGVGVINKWRAWVDLACGGDEKTARRCVQSGDAPDRVSTDLVGRLHGAWTREMDPVLEWAKDREFEAMMDPFTTEIVAREWDP